MSQGINRDLLALGFSERRTLLSKGKKRKLLLDGICHVLLLTGVVIFVFPYLWMCIRAVTPTDQIFGARLIPTHLSGEHFQQIFARGNFGRYFFNSTVVCLCTVTLGIFFDSLAGFALAKGDFPGKERLFWLIMSTMMIPIYTILVPTFIIMNTFRLRDTLTGLVIPAITSASGIFIMTQNIKTVPDSFLEAAQMDGASLFQIYLHIVLPTVRPALGALCIVRFLASWNSYLIPLIMIGDDAKKTLPLGLTTLFYQHGLVKWGALMAGSLVATIPLIVLFLIMQKQFISGIVLGSTKE